MELLEMATTTYVISTKLVDLRSKGEETLI